MTADAGRPTEAGVRKLVAWVLLGGFLVIASCAQAVYYAKSAEPSARFQLLVQLGGLVLLWHWFIQQVAHYRPRLSSELGGFLVAFWFALMPYYLWRYERWRGVLKLLGVGAVYLLSWGVSVLLYHALR